MSIGPGKYFESVIVSLPKRVKGRILVQNQLYFLVLQIFQHYLFWDTNKGITIETLKNLGTGSTYIKRNKFDKLRKIKDTLSRRIVKDNIIKFHIVREKEKHTFWGGCDFLLQCYLKRVK